MPMTPAGKEFFKKMLSGPVGRSMLAVEEEHGSSSHLTYFKDNIGDLARDNHVGSIGFEYPPFMNLFFWAYRDGKLGANQAEADKILKTVLETYCDPSFAEAAHAAVDLISAARTQGVEAFSFDVRQTAGLSFKKESEDASGAIRFIEETKMDVAAAKKANLTHAWLLAQAKKYDANPLYAKRLDAIDDMIKRLRDLGIPTDTISAILASKLAKPGANTITINGASHLIGMIDNDPGSDETGIFRDALARQGYETNSVIIGNASDVESEDVFLTCNFRVQEKCGSRHLLSGIYITDQDKAITGFARAEGIKMPAGYLERQPVDAGSCVSSPKVSTVFTPRQLNPLLDKDAREVIDKLDEILHPPTSPGWLDTAYRFWKDHGVSLLECDAPTPPMAGTTPSPSGKRR